MIYLDASVVLTRVFSEERSPPEDFWSQPLLSSRLLEYEVFNRVHVLAPNEARVMTARQLLDRVSLYDMSQDILARALEPFPVALRTLDSLHLATMNFLRARGLTLRVATYDRRLIAAATALGFSLADI